MDLDKEDSQINLFILALNLKTLIENDYIYEKKLFILERNHKM